MKKYLLFFTLIFPFTLKAQTINTICGGYLGNGDSAKAIGLVPFHSVVDKSGNIYMVETQKHLIRKLSNQGIYSVVAGTGILGFSGDGGKATAAQISDPYGLTLDAEGNLYFSDNNYSRVRKVDSNGIITTIAGNGINGYTGDSGLATAAEVTGVDAIAIDKNRNIYLADLGNSRIRKIDTNGIITTVAGAGMTTDGGDGGPATSAGLFSPIGITIDSIGELFIADVSASNIRKVDTNGIISTIAGNPDHQFGFSGDGDSATLARFNEILGSVAVDGQGNIYIPDTYNNRIRKIDKNGIINTIIGNGIKSNTGDGGSAKNASVNLPSGVNIYPSGDIYISTQHTIRKVNINSIINTVAGNGSGGFNGNGISAVKSQLYEPSCVIPDKNGHIYIADEGDFRVRKISPDGLITTVAGNGKQGFSGDDSLATLAELEDANAVTLDKTGNIYVADGSKIRKINTSGIITTIAGTGVRGFSGDGGLAKNAQLGSTSAITIDDSGNIYLTDTYYQRVRKISTTGIITTIAGNGAIGFSGDGGNATLAEFYDPISLVVDKLGNILVADLHNNRIRKISINGIITTIAGDGNNIFSGDGGDATLAGLSANAVAIDSSGNILIADANNGRIRQVNKNGIITTIAGSGSTYGDGGAALNAEIPGINSISVDKSGNIYLADYINHRIRKITNGVLATTLLNFTAQLNNNNTSLNWQTASEVNTSYFNIQRSNDGAHFNTINKVTAAGNSTSTQNYSCTDANAAALNQSTLFYRLQEVDKDGQFTYSNIVTVEFATALLFTVSPNPATDFINIVSAGTVANAAITITDMNGRTLYTGKQNFTAHQPVKIPASQFAKQVLMVTVNAANSRQVFKVVKE